MKPCGSDLLLEKRIVAEIDHLFHTLAGLFLVLTFRKQVDRRLSPEISQTQLGTRWIRPTIDGFSIAIGAGLPACRSAIVNDSIVDR